MSWDPAQYAKFADQRLRPALDLLSRIPHDAPTRVVDLGCGSGNVTEHLARRWPAAAITGVDGSDEMLAVARERESLRARKVDWIHADLQRWRAPAAVDVLYSNATLHWLPDHDALFPALFEQVRPGGILAVQMPRNFDAPSHRISYELAASARWRDKLGPFIVPTPVAEPGKYYDLLTGAGAAVEIWETEYLQALTGARPVLEWIKGTWLKPMLDALRPGEAKAFEDEYAALATAAYPARADGVTLFPFRRLFIVARRSG